jgi:hypothetical protein
MKMQLAAIVATCGLGASPAAGSSSTADTIRLVESSEAGAHWKAMAPLKWLDDDYWEPGQVNVTAQLSDKMQEIMGFGSAMTDTSAYNAMVWMDEATQEAFFEATW